MKLIFYCIYNNIKNKKASKKPAFLYVFKIKIYSTVTDFAKFLG